MSSIENQIEALSLMEQNPSSVGEELTKMNGSQNTGEVIGEAEEQNGNEMNGEETSGALKESDAMVNDNERGGDENGNPEGSSVEANGVLENGEVDNGKEQVNSVEVDGVEEVEDSEAKKSEANRIPINGNPEALNEEEKSVEANGVEVNGAQVEANGAQVEASGAQVELNGAQVEDQPEEAEGRQRRLRVIGQVPLAQKQAPHSGVGARRVCIATNIREIALAPNLIIHQYHVQVVFVMKSRKTPGSEFTVDISDSHRKGEEYEKDLRRCRRVYALVAEKYPQFHRGGPFFYDSQNTLWSFSALETEDLDLVVKDGVTAQTDFIQAKFTVQKVDGGKELRAADVVNTVSSTPAAVDQRLHHAVANILAEGPNSMKDVHTVGGACHYLIGRNPAGGAKAIFFRDGDRRSAIGVSRSIKTVEGVDGTGTLCMTNEVKLGMFYPGTEMPLIQFLQTYRQFHLNMDAGEAKKLFLNLKGFELYLDYADSRGKGEDSKTIQISGFGSCPVDQTFQREDGSTITVDEYFRQEYNINLRHKRLFTIAHEWSRGKFHYFPPELLRIVPNQRVKDSQMSKTEKDQVKNAASLRPQERFFTTERVVDEVGLVPRDLPNLVQVSAPINATGFVLPSPAHNYGRSGFIDTKKLDSWRIVFAPEKEVRDIENLIMEEIGKAGIAYEKPSCDWVENGDIFGVFARAQRANIRFLIFILPSDYEYHAHMKALEQDYDILTMHIHTRTASSMFHKTETRRNIIQKMNMKLGGLNYHVVNPYLDNEKVLILGFSLSKTQEYGNLEIVSVGYAANTSDHSHKFCGSYVFVEKDTDLFQGIITETVRKCLKEARAARSMKADKVVIYFNGISESQFATVNELYAEKCLEAFRKLGKSYSPQLTILAVSKQHTERLYQFQDGNPENLAPGTIIDNTIVSPVLNEFFHVGAKSFRGTAKAAKYTVIYSTEKVDMEWIEGLTNNLCHEHQIICTPTSLPTPLVVAYECAKRGAANLSAREEANIRDGNHLDVATMNQKYGYDGPVERLGRIQPRTLAGTRFNA